MTQGYYRFPTLHGDTLVFTCEDDLWRVSVDGGVPSRLTAGTGASTHGCFSPDGRWLAFTGREEGGTEVYVMPAEGGPVRRLTYLGANVMVAAWTPDGANIVFATNARQPLSRDVVLFSVPREGGEPVQLPWGPARHIAYGPGGRAVLGRNTGDPARWKRYRGGTAGDLWIDREGRGQFERLIPQDGNPTTPMWIGDRVYFVSDLEGFGNLYSVRPDGSDLRRHTDHETYYARQANTDGRRIVYQAGADLYVFDPATEQSRRVAIDWHSPAPQLARKFVDAARFVDGTALHPDGHALALTTRGKAFAMGDFAGPVVQLGAAHGVRYRLPAWLRDGARIVAVTDELGEEALVVFAADGASAGTVIGPLDLGRVVELAVSPTADRVAIANHRYELLLVDLETRELRRLDKSGYGPLAGIAWSPDGAWIAYGFPDSAKTSRIQLAEAATGKLHAVTEPVLRDERPAFDPKGDYLYFISYRYFDPVYDSMHFELGFPRGARPCVVTLRAELDSPFLPRVGPEKKEEKPEDKGEPKDEAPKPVVIDFEGIAARVAPFPVSEGRYEQVAGLDGKAIFSSHEPEGALADDSLTPAAEAKSKLEVYDFQTQKAEVLIEAMTAFAVSGKHQHVLVQVGDRFRVLPAGEKPKPDAPQEPGRESGWLDLGRVRVSIEPREEWRQMFREAWRLQRDQFWTADMSAVNWQRVHDLYLPLVDRLSTRSEFSDLLWEMQGELGTSHAYELGGDYRPAPSYLQGHLGADFVWDASRGGYRVTHIPPGDPGLPDQHSPLARPGANVREGDVLVAVNGQALSATFAPNQALVHQADQEVQLTFAPRNGEGPRRVRVKTVPDEFHLRYRAWVDTNRRRVHEASNGKLGYVHIPDMGPFGFAEFHRGYLPETAREGLVVDVRYNGGGHVSQLLLEKLARKRLGYDVERWGAVKPYPEDSIAGPMVCLTNELAGSDGDIFSHCFKLMQLGPLLGKRTWGGVIGIWPRHALVDGTVTTQPEFSFWFTDVGWGVENYGAEPDIVVEYPPQAYAAHEDPQLDASIAKCLELLAANPPVQPNFAERPNLAPPQLPARR